MYATKPAGLFPDFSPVRPVSRSSVPAHKPAFRDHQRHATKHWQVIRSDDLRTTPLVHVLPRFFFAAKACALSESTCRALLRLLSSHARAVLSPRIASTATLHVTPLFQAHIKERRRRGTRHPIGGRREAGERSEALPASLVSSSVASSQQVSRLAYPTGVGGKACEKSACTRACAIQQGVRCVRRASGWIAVALST